MFDIDTFRELTKEVISAEKEGFWSDWTKEQQWLYKFSDWESFSKSRGYNEKEIEQFKQWLKIIDEAHNQGINALEFISDLVLEAANKNIQKDKNEEILKSSHLPKIKPSKDEVRIDIMNIEKKMRTLPGAMLDDCFPLKHSFGKGCYVREISVPRGTLIVTKIHKVAHPCFVLKGECSVLTEDGVKRIKAPYYCITPAGTKRVVYVHEDTVWVTVHITEETDLKKIEEEIIAKTYDDILPSYEEILKLQEA